MSSGKCRLTLMTHRDTPLLIPVASPRVSAKGTEFIHSFIYNNGAAFLLYSIPSCRYHEERMVNYDAEEGVTVSSNSHKSSILTVQNATIRHEGNYTCAPANARPTSISVHVLKGKWWLKTKTRRELKVYSKGQANDFHQWLALCFVHSRREARRNAASSQECSEYLFQF